MPLESSTNKHTVTLQCYNRSNWLIQSLFALKSIWHVSWCYARATDEYLLRLNNSSRTNIIEWWANVFRHLKRDGCYDFIRMTWESVYVILRHSFSRSYTLQQFVFMRFLSVRVFHFINIYSAPKFIFTSSYFVSTRYLETYHFIRLMYFKCGSLHKTMPQECNITLHIHRNIQWYRETKKNIFYANPFQLV